MSENGVERVIQKRNRPSRSPKNRVLYRLTELRALAVRVAGFGLEAELQLVLDLIDEMEVKAGALPDDYKQSRGASAKIVRLGQIYEIVGGRDRYSKLAGEPVEMGIAVAELDEKLVRVQIGEGTFIPVRKKDLGKIIT